MSTFLAGGGVDCGPTNVLKNVGARVDRDVSLHQDRLVSVPNVASSSKQPFRPSIAPPPTNQTQRQYAPTPFDLSSLRNHLVPAQSQPLHSLQPSSEWADAFRAQAQVSSRAPAQTQRVQSQQPAVHAHGWQNDFASHLLSTTERERARSASPAIHHDRQTWSQPMPYQPRYQAALPPWMNHQQQISPFDGAPMQSRQSDPSQWQPESGSVATQETARSATAPLDDSQEVLARTARSFVDELENSSDILAANPKLAQSKFMTLLRGIGSESVVIEDGEATNGEEIGDGAQFVSRSETQGDWARDFVSDSGAANVAQAADPVSIRNEYIAARSPYPQGVKTYPALNSWASPYPDPQMSVSAADNGQLWDRQFLDQEALIRSSEAEEASDQGARPRRKSVHFRDSSADKPLGGGVPRNLEEALASRTTVPGAGAAWEDPSMDEDLDVFDEEHAFDEETFALFNGVMRQASSGVVGVGAREGWGEMQNDWEAFQRSEPGAKELRGMGRGDRVERYMFQGENPYAAVINDELNEMDRGSPTLKGVLELEAAVQTEPTSHEAWYSLGLKQQENEREDQAILALSKVVQLEPEYRPAYLALAVSYTNEGESEAACTMIERWIRLGEGSLEAAEQSGATSSAFASREGLIARLIDIARRNPHEIEADVQEALGVLFNASEDYSKAEDCFLAALAVKPDDWLLYNRLGATLANSGRSNEAIQYYHRALSIHPNFVRALFNLSISYVNLGQYPLAAQSALDALRIQDADASQGYGYGQVGNTVKGVTSSSLWNTLKGACLHMNRLDLVDMVERRDLFGFPESLSKAPSSTDTYTHA